MRWCRCQLLLLAGDKVGDELRLRWWIDHHFVRVVLSMLAGRPPGGGGTSCPRYATWGAEYIGSEGGGGREAICSTTIPVSSMA
jgi:hypothetical protein